jgi:hypothetical protein
MRSTVTARLIGVATTAVFLLPAPGLAESTQLAAAGASPPTVVATVSTRSLLSTANHSFTLYLHIENAGPVQALELDVGGGAWPDLPMTAGGPLSFGAPLMQGPGSVRVLTESMPPLRPGTCVRGVLYGGAPLQVSVPAETNTTVALPVSAVLPALPGTNYTPQVSFGYSERWFPPIPVAVPAIQMTGPTGFAIELAAGHSANTLAAGKRVRIVGTTTPAVRSGVVRVTARRMLRADGELTYGAVRRLGVVRTDARGRFRLKRWTPPGPGEYQILASIAHPGGGLMHDHSCPITLSVDTRR